MTANTPTRSRRWRVPLLIFGIIVLFGVIFSQAAFNLTFLRPENLSQTFIFAALSAVIFLGLVALIFVLLRTMAKLYLERQAGVLGSRFRTKMVLGALVLSIGPAVALFFFSYGLMNRSIDKWFSRPVEEVGQHTAAVTSLLTGYAGENASSEARAIASSPDTIRAYKTKNFGSLMDEFRRRELTLQDGFAIAMYDDNAQAIYHAPMAWFDLRRKLPIGALNRNKPQQFTLNGRDYLLAAASVGDKGRILVALPLPSQYSETLRSLDESQQEYIQLRAERKLIRQTYMQFLLLITLLVLFASTWFSLFLSKLVTRPVMALAQATEEISSGNLEYRIEERSHDELGRLIASFNRMASELDSNKRQIDANRAELAEANSQIEERRRHMETILESIPSGVLSLDRDGKITRVNAALIRMFRPERVQQAGSQADLSLSDIFEADVAVDLQRMLRRADRMGMTTAPVEIATPDGTLNVSVTVASMDSGRRSRSERLGYVLVFEDLSEMLRGQKQAAWSEVARRIAHEIKNPLTPITLSAERIRRHLSRGIPSESSLAVIHACAETIAGAAETVRQLVDEFSTLARFPQSQPSPADINAIVESALALFEGRLDGIIVRTHLASDLPNVLADFEGIKRVVSNLVDNAAEAVKDSIVREIHVSTGLAGSRDVLEIVVSDSGHGITPEMKERLFLPYFSTKQRGTGLGLAIVNRIVEDHHGTIRVEENRPVGARFVVELPATSETEHSGPETANATTN